MKSLFRLAAFCLITLPRSGFFSTNLQPFPITSCSSAKRSCLFFISFSLSRKADFIFCYLTTFPSNLTLFREAVLSTFFLFHSSAKRLSIQNNTNNHKEKKPDHLKVPYRGVPAYNEKRRVGGPAVAGGINRTRSFSQSSVHSQSSMVNLNMHQSVMVLVVVDRSSKGDHRFAEDCTVVKVVREKV